MRHLIIIAMAIIIYLAMIKLKKHRVAILLGGISFMALICGAYGYSRSEGILKTIKPINQTFYNNEFLETGEFPDAFLRLYFKDKNVYVKDDEITMAHAEYLGYSWMYAFYHAKDMKNYLDSVGARVIPDENMNRAKVTEEIAEDFENLGYTSDLLRNTVMYTKTENDCGNYLFYQTYYREMCDTSYIFLNTESLKDTDELVLLWQHRLGSSLETEDMYLMGKDYYEEHFKE